MIRAARGALLAVALACAVRHAGAQEGPSDGRIAGPFLFYGVAGVAQTRFLSDGNGTTVGAHPTVAGEVGLSWAWSERGEQEHDWHLGLQLRGGFPTVRIEHARGTGPGHDAGRVTILDLALRLDRRFDVARVHAAAGAGFLNGPSDVAPFRFAGVDGLSGAGEVGVARLLHGDYVWATLTAQLVGLDARSDPDGFTSGTFTRVLLGVRLAP